MEQIGAILHGEGRGNLTWGRQGILNMDDMGKCNVGNTE
jgi:hypothetical protein